MGTKRDALRQRRQFLGYTQTELAKRVGVDRSTVVRWESDETDPGRQKRAPLAAALGIRPADLDILLAGETVMPAEPDPVHTHTQAVGEVPVVHTGLPTVHARTTALITDSTGGVLLVKRRARDWWTLPGGIVAGTESPHAACSRILREDLGFRHRVGGLLIVDWTPSTGVHRATVHLVFDGGTIPEGTVIRLGGDWAHATFITPDRISADLSADDATRIRAARHARTSKATTYLPGNTTHRRPAARATPSPPRARAAEHDNTTRPAPAQDR